MKKLWIVLLSLAIVAAFCMPASAVEVKFSGSYYVAGDYYSDLDIVDSGTLLGTKNVIGAPYALNPATGQIDGTPIPTPGYGSDKSTAFFRQRLRIQTEFVVSPGLSLITRFDALEKIWGDQQWTGSRSPYASRSHDVSGNMKEQENIEFEQAYIQYMSKVGMWWIGLAPHDFWGTTFGDSTQTEALVQWILPINQNWIIGAKYFKHYENSPNLFGGRTSDSIDADDSAYVGVAIFKTQDIETGMKVAYRKLAQNKDSAIYAAIPPYTEINGWLLTPYFKGKFGPVSIQAEAEYWYGEVELQGNAPWATYQAMGLPLDATDSIDMEFLAVYLDGKVDIGPGYVGGRLMYVSGDDLSTGDKFEGSNFLNNRAFEMCWGGVDLKQTLILWNEDVTLWVGDVWNLGPGVKNAKLLQAYGGYNWKDFTFAGSLAYAKADETMPGQDDDYGYELDVTAAYKITNNLTYMVGAGYLWTGDYFKYNNYGYTGGTTEVDVDDVYLITNKLTLSF